MKSSNLTTTLSSHSTVCVSVYNNVWCDGGGGALSHVVRLSHVCMQSCLWNLSVSVWMDLGRVCVSVWSPVAVMWRWCSDCVRQVHKQTGVPTTRHYIWNNCRAQQSTQAPVFKHFHELKCDWFCVTTEICFLPAERLLLLQRRCKILRKGQREGESGG